MKNLLQVETPTPSTRQLNGLELIDNLSGANALSVIENKQIGDYKVLSISANDIIPQKNNQSQTFELIKNDGSLIFIKDFNDKKFFASIARDTNGEWIITNNAPKSLNNVKNKLKQGGKLLYNDLKELETIKINANDFTQEANSPKQQATNDIIPQQETKIKGKI